MARISAAVLLLAVASSCLAATIPLNVSNPSGLAATRHPVTTGIPFPPAALSSETQVRLLGAGGQEIPLQALCTGKHRDGSVRWLLLDFQVDIPAQGCQLTLEYGPGVQRQAVPQPLRVAETPAAFTVNTGPLQVTLDRSRCDGLRSVALGDKAIITAGHNGGAYFVTDDGQEFRACQDQKPQVAIESQGPLRSVITTRGWFASAAGDRKCQFTIRYHFFAGLPVVRVMYTWLMTEDSRQLRFRDIGFRLPVRTTSGSLLMDDGKALELAPTAAQPAGLVQYEYDKSKLLGGGAITAQTLGAITATGSSGSCCLQVRDFRELFPKEFSLTPDALTFHVWPAHGVKNPDRKVEDANLQYIWYAHEGEVLDFQAPEAFYNHKEGLSDNDYRYLRSSQNANAMGLAKTHEMLLSFGTAADNVAARVFNEPPACAADPKWMCDSGVFGAMQPYSPDLFPKYEKLISENFDAEQRMQAFTRDYGMWNWGDSHTSWNMAKRRWDDAYRCWRNTHHGAPRVPWLLYVRSGDPKYLAYALRNTRHILDVDFCHYSTPEFEALDYPRGKLKGALNDYKGIVHWHSGNRLMDYNSMTDFALWYWHMTGDRWGFEVASDWGEAVKAKFTAPFGSRSGTGTMSALIDLYTDTWDESYRPIIERFFTHLTTKVQNVDGTVKYSDHVLAYWPQHKDKNTPLGSFPEWENYAPWIERYWDLTHSDAAKKALVAWADSYLQGYGDMSSLWGTREYMNILAYAYLATGDPKYLGRGVWESDKAVGSVYVGDDPLLKGFMLSGQVSLGGYIIQRLPAFMKALATYGKPVAPDPLMLATPGFPLLFTRTRPTVDGKPTKIETVEFWVLEDRDQDFAVGFPTAHTYPQRTYAITVYGPDGKQVHRQDETYPKGTKDLSVKLPADGQAGLYRFEVAAEGSMGSVGDPVTTTPKLPVAFPLAGRIVPASGARYYLFAAVGTKQVKVEIGGFDGNVPSAQGTSPDRNLKLSSAPVEGKPEQVLTLPTGEQAGQCWEIILSGSPGLLQVLADGQPAPQMLFAETYPAETCTAFLAALR